MTVPEIKDTPENPNNSWMIPLAWRPLLPGAENLFPRINQSIFEPANWFLTAADTTCRIDAKQTNPFMPVGWQKLAEYNIDFWERSVLFWDVLRQRGNQYLEHQSQPVQHVLSYDYERVMDGREFERPVNYGLVRIVPPEGVEVDHDKRPFVIVDPRAGHGPGIGGFKTDSQVGAVLKAGHPCYFIGFLADPLPGQTIEDVGRAEVQFLRRVAELHPTTDGKPCVIANCQAGWAMMMLASIAPDTVGPMLVAGSPLSYWAGVRGQNPMRYSGGILGGTWLTSLTGDIGHGIFDGAWLVTNFENLNPSNTLWSKHYKLWSKIDTEAPRYLDFERWWGGHVLLTADEMQFITDELFVGNRLTRGEIQTSDGITVDLRNIKSPIVVFCSYGDNITPPQQALGWILDLYNDVEEIRAQGQTIVYNVHDDIGHLGIFVSGKVGRKEHDQFTQNMDLIDVLPPGLYEAVIREKTGEDANADLAYGEYIVSFERRDLDDVRAFGDEGHEDDPAFEAVSRISDINQRLYQALASPLIKPMFAEQTAKWLREMHPARLQYSLFSDKNPFIAPIAGIADSVRETRHSRAEDNPLVDVEKQLSKMIVDSLDAWRNFRDNAIEQLFFTVYGSDWLQASVGVKSSTAERKVRIRPRDPAHDALMREKISRQKARMNVGGPREAAIRGLIYVGLEEGIVDERGFGALRMIREQTPAEEQISLQEFKAIVRDQFLLLAIDEEDALTPLMELLPAKLEQREELFQRIVKVVEARGPLSDSRRERLNTLALHFGLGQDGAVNAIRPRRVD